MKNAIAGLLLGVSLSVGACAAGAQVTKSGAGYLFRVKWTKGEKLSYTLNMRMKLPQGMAQRGGQTPANGAMNIVSPFNMSVTDVKGKIASLHLEIGPVSMNGKPGTAAQKLDIQMDDRGKPTGLKMPGMDNLMAAMPEKPLKIGESYTTNNSINQRGQSINVKTTITFSGIKSVGAKQVAVLATNATATGGMSSKTQGTQTILMSDGSLYSSKVNVTMSAPGGQGSMQQQVSIVRK